MIISSKVLVPRHVRVVNEQDPDGRSALALPLEEFQDVSAWVLLGEPGAGKSTVFLQESERTSATFCALQDFLDDLIPTGTGPIFLDGLDEVRAATGDAVLGQIRRKLAAREQRFRISCRAADWYGATEASALAKVSPDGKILVLQLEPLSREEIETILGSKGLADPASLIKAVESMGLDDLLNNPQNLELIAAAYRKGTLPDTKEALFRAACEVMAEEVNDQHLAVQRKDTVPLQEILDMAGFASCILLMSNYQGVALSSAGRGHRFLDNETLNPANQKALRRALDSRLFRGVGPDRLQPSHRTVAEYLAARWLAQTVDREGFPSRRVSTLLTGFDEKSVSGLRGLYAWLATLSTTLRNKLISNDPLTVLVYGDGRYLPANQKRAILSGLVDVARWNAGALWDHGLSTAYGTLACPELQEDFVRLLEEPDRSPSNDSLAFVVLEALLHGMALNEMAPIVFSMIGDSYKSTGNRRYALRTWIRLSGEISQAVQLLHRIKSEDIEDSDDELLGVLLDYLYPTHISAELLLECLHLPKESSLVGAYYWFVEQRLVPRIPQSHIPILVVGLEGKNQALPNHHEERFLVELSDKVLLKGLECLGTQLDAATLYDWLGVRWYNQMGWSRVQTSSRESIAQWLTQNPSSYLSVLAEFYSRCRGKDPWSEKVEQWGRFCWAEFPPGIGRWFLESFEAETDDALKKSYLGEVIQMLIHGHKNLEIGFDELYDWAELNSERLELLKPLLCADISTFRVQSPQSKAWADKQEEQRRDRTSRIQPLLPELAEGICHAAFLDQAARIWSGRYFEARGETPEERFTAFSENGREFFAAAQLGFVRCLSRDDIPTWEAILDLDFEGKYYFLQEPCLLGVENLRETGLLAVSSLPGETVRSLVAFLLVSKTNEVGNWFSLVCRDSPEVVRDVLVAHVTKAWNHKVEHIAHLHWFSHPEPYMYSIVREVAYRLLPLFPRHSLPIQHDQFLTVVGALRPFDSQVLDSFVVERLDSIGHGHDLFMSCVWMVIDLICGRHRLLSQFFSLIGSSEEGLFFSAEAVMRLSVKEETPRDISPKVLGRIVHGLSGHTTSMEFRSGWVTREDTFQTWIRGLVSMLENDPRAESSDELNRLVLENHNPELDFLLRQARDRQRNRLRDDTFVFLVPGAIVRVLQNGDPASARDLFNLTVQQIDEVADEIRNGNDDGYRGFWNGDSRLSAKPKIENTCRDQLLTRLKFRLKLFGVDCSPESDYSGDKRADIKVSYRADFAIPVEVKKESHSEVWSAIDRQLIPRYTMDPSASGHGIYIVLWFGGDLLVQDPAGLEAPKTAQALQRALESRQATDEGGRIAVRVIDVSWPV